MLKKHAVLVGILCGMGLLFMATRLYPGGTQNDVKAIGFSWQHNYLCHLFNSKALNGADNPAPNFAIPGMLLLCISFALFFNSFSKKISSQFAAGMIKYFGGLGMAFGFFIVTPYHNLMIILSSCCAAISLMYVSVFIFTSKRNFLKIWTVISLLVLFACNYIYYTDNYLHLLPVVQKMVMVCSIIWFMQLEYFTSGKDFQQSTWGKAKEGEKV